MCQYVSRGVSVKVTGKLSKSSNDSIPLFVRLKFEPRGPVGESLLSAGTRLSWNKEVKEDQTGGVRSLGDCRPESRETPVLFVLLSLFTRRVKTHFGTQERQRGLYLGPVYESQQYFDFSLHPFQVYKQEVVSFFSRQEKWSKRFIRRIFVVCFFTVNYPSVQNITRVKRSDQNFGFRYLSQYRSLDVL